MSTLIGSDGPSAVRPAHGRSDPWATLDAMRRALQRLAVGRKSAATPSAALQAVADARRMQGVEPHREHVLTKVILHGGE